MKKIFTLFAILLVLVLPIVSCSSDDVSAKQAETDRGSLEIPNDEDTSNIQYNQLALYVNKTSAQTGELVTFTTMLNGVNVTNEASYFINGIEIGGYSIASNFPGTFQVQAKLEGYIDSPIVTVVYGGGSVNPDPDPDPTGNLIFNGQGYNVVANILILHGNFLNTDQVTARSEWSSVVVDNTDLENVTVAAVIRFDTPFTITNLEEGQGTINYPNGTNEQYKGITQFFANGQEFEDQVGQGQIHYTESFDIASNTNTFTSSVTFGGNTLQINYNGQFVFQDQSQDEEDEPQARPTNQLTNSLAKFKIQKTKKYFRLK